MRFAPVTIFVPVLPQGAFADDDQHFFGPSPDCAALLYREDDVYFLWPGEDGIMGWDQGWDEGGEGGAEPRDWTAVQAWCEQRGVSPPWAVVVQGAEGEVVGPAVAEGKNAEETVRKAKSENDF